MFEKGKSGNPATTFQPGVSGNPSGRPSRRRKVMALLIDLLNEPSADGSTAAEQLARAMIDGAIRSATEGDIGPACALMNQVYGTPRPRQAKQGSNVCLPYKVYLNFDPDEAV
jgi:Family of unknown function (DUF5681)